MNALLFFAILFCLLYSIIAHVNKSERMNRKNNLQEIPVKMRRKSRSVAVPQVRDDEAAGFLLLTDNLTGDDND